MQGLKGLPRQLRSALRLAGRRRRFRSRKVLAPEEPYSEEVSLRAEHERINDANFVYNQRSVVP